MLIPFQKNRFGNTYAFKNCNNISNKQQIPITWGGTNVDWKATQTELSFEISIAANDTFVLPLHYNYRTHDVQATSLKESYLYYDNINNTSYKPTYQFVINWGDGTKSKTIKADNNKAFEAIKWNLADPDDMYYGYIKNFPTPDNTNIKSLGIPDCAHTYKQSGMYTITISGKLECLYVHKNDKFTWRHLKTVNSLGRLRI